MLRIIRGVVFPGKGNSVSESYLSSKGKKKSIIAKSDFELSTY